MDARCRIELFGWLRVHQDSRVITRFPTRQTGALLAYLAYYPHRSHPRDLLTEIIWPEDAGTTDRHKLRKALTSLRRQLEPPGALRGYPAPARAPGSGCRRYGSRLTLPPPQDILSHHE